MVMAKFGLLKFLLELANLCSEQLATTKTKIRTALRTKMKIKLSVLHDSGLFASSGRVRKRKREGKFLNPRLN